MSESNSDLTRLVWDRTVSSTAIAVLLFTDDTLQPAEDDDAADTMPQVTAAAARLGIDLADLKLFSTEAYRLQSALGEIVLPA